MKEFKCYWIKNGKEVTHSIYEAPDIECAKKKAEYYMMCMPNKYDSFVFK